MSQSSAEQVTYSFVNFYYTKLHESPTELYHAYTKDATLTHSKIPSNNEEQEIINKSIEFEQVSSVQEIEQFYAKSNIKNCKIRVSSIDYQTVALNNSVLISIIGELALTDESPVYRFTQSFILVPSKVANAYDISNDILRLIPDDDFELNQEDAVEEDVKVEEPPNKAQEEKVEDLKPNGEVKLEAPKEEEDKRETKEESEEEVVVPEAKEELVEEEQKIEPVAEEAKSQEPKSEEPKDEPVEEEAPKVEAKPVKMSWAQISSSAAPAIAPAPVIPTKTKVKQQGTTANTATSKEPKENSPKQPLQNITNQKNQRKRFEHLYPVYIKGTEVLSAQELKIALDQEFGKTTKVEPRGNYALADFETERSQQKALTSKHLKIGKSTITIEPKTKEYEFKDRKQNKNNNQNNSNANNKSKDGQRTHTNYQKKKTTNNKSN